MKRVGFEMTNRAGSYFFRYQDENRSLLGYLTKKYKKMTDVTQKHQTGNFNLDCSLRP